MYKIVIGVDIAKLKFDVASFSHDKYKHKVFTNNEQGYQQFLNWLLLLFADDKLLICMEATGAYSLPLAEFMVNQGYAVSVVNPAKIKAFAGSELSRTKPVLSATEGTDKADAKLIARYAITMQPALWTPPPENIRILQALTRRVEHLLKMILMERNRLETATPSIVNSINSVLATLEDELKTTRKAIHDHIDNDPDLKQRHNLLITIPSIADATIPHLINHTQRPSRLYHRQASRRLCRTRPRHTPIRAMVRQNPHRQKRRHHLVYASSRPRGGTIRPFALSVND